MIELIYFMELGSRKKAYHLIQFRPAEYWHIVDGDELIGRLEKRQGLWTVHAEGGFPESVAMELAKLIEAQHFNRLPDEIKTHWPGKVLEVIVVDDAQYLIICQRDADMESFVKLFRAYAPHLLKDEWAVLFKIYNAEMTEDFEVTVQRGKV